MKTFWILAISFLTIHSLHSQNSLESAESIMTNAFEQAKTENKNVFVLFTASWCGWCKKMDASMKDETTKELFSKNYVIKKLTVLERKSKKHLENEGSEDFLNKYGGKNQGIPYYLIFDSNGNLLADSKMIKGENVLKGKGTNIGCPGLTDEIDAFLYKLENTSNLTSEELIIIAKRFKQNNTN